MNPRLRILLSPLWHNYGEFEPDLTHEVYMLPRRWILLAGVSSWANFGAVELPAPVEQIAGTIKVTAQLQISSGNFYLPRQSPQVLEFVQHVMGGACPGVVNVGTAEEDIDTTELYQLGWAYIRNLGDYPVLIGPKVSGSLRAFIELEPGEPALFRLRPGVVIRAKALGGASKVLFSVNEN